MNLKEAIARIVKREHLSEAEMMEVMNEVMAGGASDIQIGAFLTALRMKGEIVDELTGAARVMREKATKIKAPEGAVDTCGTGGDGSMTFNISTAAALVAAGSGLTVAKHGNRSVSSISGSADVLRALKVNIAADVSCVEECIREVGIGFLFAPMLHGAVKHAAKARSELGIRSIFNIIGPLTNPAGAKRQVIGVYDPNLTEILAKVLLNLGSERAFIVCGKDGLDEITLADDTWVTELKGSKTDTYTICPEQFGFKRCEAGDLVGGDSQRNADIITDVLNGKKGPARDVVILNAAAAITAGKLLPKIEDGIEIARDAIDSGRALEKLERLKEVTNR